MWIKIIGLLRQVPPVVWVILVVGGALVGTIINLSGELQKEKTRSRQIALVLDSTQAANDTLRNITDSITNALDLAEGERSFFQKRAIQTEIEKDSIDNLLSQRSAVQAKYEAQIGILEDTITAITNQVGENREASFEEYVEPYTVKMHIILPPPPKLASAEISVSVDPFDIGIRLACSPTNELTGLHPASVLLDTPSWITINEVNVTQDPEVCNPIKPTIPFIKSWKMGVLTTTILTIGGALIFK